MWTIYIYIYLIQRGENILPKCYTFSKCSILKLWRRIAAGKETECDSSSNMTHMVIMFLNDLLDNSRTLHSVHRVDTEAYL